MPALAYANGPVARVLTVVVGVAVVGVVVVHSHKPRPAIENGHTISLSLRNVYVATLFKLLGWTGRPAPCALRVSDQSGSTVVMEYDKGKISARGREISWLTTPVTWDTRVR